MKFYDVYSFTNFSFRKSHRKFSRMVLDQIHEQNNKLIKGCGGASDLLTKWMIQPLFAVKLVFPKLPV